LVLLIGMALRALPTSASVDAVQRPAPVVALTAHACGESRAGSGTVVGPRLVVTAAHVVDRAAVVVVDGPTGTVPGTVVAIDPEGRDLALVLVDEPLGIDDGRDGRDVAVGDVLTATGHPGGGPLAAIDGTVVSLAAARDFGQAGDGLVVFTAGFPPGMSGGPVADADGRLVAIVVGTEQGSGTGIAVPVREVRDLLRQGATPPAPVCPASGSGTGTAASPVATPARGLAD
jgi:S1-C subfamily serine protease